jgi:hypothetical protein
MEHRRIVRAWRDGQVWTQAGSRAAAGERASGALLQECPVAGLSIEGVSLYE